MADFGYSESPQTALRMKYMDDAKLGVIDFDQNGFLSSKNIIIEAELGEVCSISSLQVTSGRYGGPPVGGFPLVC